MFLLMSRTNNFAKNFLSKIHFLTPFWDSTKFSLFCKVCVCRFSFDQWNCQKFNFHKKCLKCCRNVSFDEWNKYFAKKYFLTPFWDSTKFSLFCKVRACRFSVKNSIFQKLPQMLRKCFFWSVEQIILPKKYFLTPFWDSTKFSLFCKVRTCRFSVKNSIFQKLPQML